MRFISLTILESLKALAMNFPSNRYRLLILDNEVVLVDLPTGDGNKPSDE